MAEVAQGELQILSNDYQKLQEGVIGRGIVAFIVLLTPPRSTDYGHSTSTA